MNDRAYKRIVRERDMWKSLYQNEVGNAKELLRYIVKKERSIGIDVDEEWDSWMDQYGIRRRKIAK